jgi:murein DD-endopeptidase MepM/ murein hydrolase activator NlpD
MSSLHQDHLLVEGTEPAKGARTTLAAARGTARRPAREKAPSKVPTQRQGKARRSGTASTTVDGPSAAPAARSTRAPGGKTVAGALAARAKAATAATTKAASAKAATARTARTATVKAASAKAATAKTATVKAATARAATAKAATAKAATAARAAADAKVEARTSSARPARSARPASAATPAAKPATAVKAAPAAKPAIAAKAAPAAKQATVVNAEVARVRPTPYKRAEAARPAPAPEVPAATQADVALEPTAPGTSVVEATEVVASVAEGRRPHLLRRRPPSVRRRPALYLAAALVGAISVSGFTSGDPQAQATDTMSHSVSVAEELGITAQPIQAITDTHAAERLGELAVSRNLRGAEQAAAAQAQAAADQAAVAAAAEAARPKAILPVAGARLTSGFGARWGTLHAGIDLAAPMRTPEMAVMDGVVLEAGPASGFGLAVYIQHENGDVTVYGHMDEILVQPGQVVRAGDTIALLGNRGQSTGPHLHFEVHVGGINGEKIDPLPWLRERGVAV